jgi:hypothetical protein
MTKTVTTYKPKLTRLLPILAVPIALAVSLLLIRGALSHDLVVGILLFFLAALIPAFLVAGNKVEINDEKGTVLAYMFGTKILELTPGSVQEIREGYLFPILPGGAGFGRGIILRGTYKGKARILRMGVGLYGDAAVGHVKKVLQR